jgi:ankyrin repeat protein
MTKKRTRSMIAAILLLGIWLLPRCCFADDPTQLLQEGVLLNSSHAVQKALKEGASPNLTLLDGTPILALAILRDEPDIVQILLNAKADVNTSFHVPPSSPLLTYYHQAFPTQMVFLEPNGLITPLVLAATGPHANARIVEMLLRRGANPNVDAFPNHSLLSIAVLAGFQKRDVSVVQALVQHGAKLTTQDGFIVTEIHNGVQSHFRFMQLHTALDAFWEQLETSKYAGASYSDVQVDEYCRQVIGLFLKHGYKLDSYDSEGFTLLDEAIYHDLAQTAALLLQAGVDINQKDRYRGLAIHHTPLWWAKLVGAGDIARMLEAKGAKSE